LTETYHIAITIVGTTPGGEKFSEELAALMDGVRDVLERAMPTFTPAHPPVSVTTYELLAAPEHKRVSPLIQTAEYDIITAARQWNKGVRGSAERLRAAVETYERFPE